MHAAARVLGRGAIGLLVAAAVGTALPAPAAAPVRTAERALIVRSHGPLRITALQRSLGGAVHVTGVEPIARDIAAVRVRVPATTTAATAARLVAAGSAVESATPEARFTALDHALGAKPPVTVPDSAFSQQWALWDATSLSRAGGYGIDAPRAWTRSTGRASVVVAVLDTGITAHPNLAGVHLAPGYDFVDGDDDPTDPGDACTSDHEPSSWHGTFVTGEIAAQPGTGVAGAAPGVTVEPVRVLGACGGDEATTIRGLLWAAGVPVVVGGATMTDPEPASVVSMSLGGAGACDSAMQAAVDEALAKGVVVVVAAGNDGGAIADASPSGCRGVLSVVATGRSGRVASYSDHGTAAVPATIAAPGGDVDERNVRDGLIIGDSWTDTGAYTGLPSHAALAWDAGTSMATPLVAASVALLRGVHPELTPAEVIARVQTSATPFPAAAHCTPVRCGAGIVNAGNLLQAVKRFVDVQRPTITGTLRVGRRLTASPGTWRSAPTAIGYSWLRDGVPIAGATAVRYRLTAADGGHRVTVTVTVRRQGYHEAHASRSVRIPELPRSQD